MASEKRVVFRSAWLPWALLAPQVAIIAVFFFWPALQALWFMLALRQFFVLDLRRDGLRLLLAGGLFAVLKWQATALYARAVVELVLWQMGM